MGRPHRELMLKAHFSQRARENGAPCLFEEHVANGDVGHPPSDKTTGTSTSKHWRIGKENDAPGPVKEPFVTFIELWGRGSRISI
jgi:hypothetical protein